MQENVNFTWIASLWISPFEKYMVAFQLSYNTATCSLYYLFQYACRPWTCIEGCKNVDSVPGLVWAAGISRFIKPYILFQNQARNNLFYQENLQVLLRQIAFHGERILGELRVRSLQKKSFNVDKTHFVALLHIQDFYENWRFACQFRQCGNNGPECDYDGDVW